MRLPQEDGDAGAAVRQFLPLVYRLQPFLNIVPTCRLKAMLFVATERSIH